MTCSKCTDIHSAQREGKLNQGCECECHCNSTNIGGLVCTCNYNTTSTAICPVHGWFVNGGNNTGAANTEWSK